MAQCHSSVIVTGAATDTRARDQLSFPITFRPQAMTVYVRFVELGTASMLSSANNRLLQIGAATDPRFAILGISGGAYQAFLDNGPTQSVVTASGSPSYGSRVELCVTISSAGLVTIIQSINGAATTTATAASAAALPSAWSSATIWFNSISTATVGYAAYRNVEIVQGVRTMQQMRVLAGTD